jgi:hypothetical protein
VPHDLIAVGDVMLDGALPAPAAGWTWFGMEYDAGEGVFWGYVESGLDPSYDEFGYFTLDELESLGARVERDLNFDPTPIGKIQAARGRY